MARDCDVLVVGNGPPGAAKFDAEDQLIFSAPHHILAGSAEALERLLGEGVRITGAEVSGRQPDAHRRRAGRHYRR